MSRTVNTLYTELGVPEDATREEVRAAYWQKAKEWHPDKAETEDERELAVQRMSQLNELMATLGDEEARAAYDLELKLQRDAEAAGLRKVSVAASVEAWKGKAGSARKKWPLYSAAALLALSGAWVASLLLNDSEETQWWQSRARQNAPGAVSVGAGAAPKPQANPEKQDRVRVVTSAPAARNPLEVAPRTVPVKSAETAPAEVSPLVEEARRAMERKREIPREEIVAPKPTEAVVVSAPPSPVPVRIEVPPPAPVEIGSVWSGHWRYAASLGGGLGGAYAPQSIEMRIQTRERKLQGVYKAKYLVSNRKYSNRVEFSFEGWADNDTAVKGVWRDQSGARGEFELKRVAGRVVEMNWWTTSFGRSGALASGVARLELGN